MNIQKIEAEMDIRADAQRMITDGKATLAMAEEKIIGELVKQTNFNILRP